jgi:hypothetical protein
MLARETMIADIAKTDARGDGRHQMPIHENVRMRMIVPMALHQITDPMRVVE